MFFGKKKKTYSEAMMIESVKQTMEAENNYKRLLKKYNKIIDEVNYRGGREFLDNAVMPDEYSSRSRSNVLDDLSDKDFKDLMMLCHPDKHSGSERATRVTRKILLMWKS